MKCEQCNIDAVWWLWEDGEHADAKCPNCGALYTFVLVPPKVRKEPDRDSLRLIVDEFPKQSETDFALSIRLVLRDSLF